MKKFTKKLTVVFPFFILGAWNSVFAPQMALQEDRVDSGSVLHRQLEELNQAIRASLDGDSFFSEKLFIDHLEALINRAEASECHDFVPLALNGLIDTIAPTEHALGVFQKDWLNVLASVAARRGYPEVVGERLYRFVKNELERAEVTDLFLGADVVWQGLAPKLIRCHSNDFTIGYSFYFVQMHLENIDCNKAFDLLIFIATQLVFAQSSDRLFAECMECFVQLFQQKYDALDMAQFMDKIFDWLNSRNNFTTEISLQLDKSICFVKAIADLNRYKAERESDVDCFESARTSYGEGCMLALSVGRLAKAKQLAELAGNPNLMVEHVGALRRFCNSQTNCIAARQAAVVKRRFGAMRLSSDVAALIAAFISPREVIQEEIRLNWPQLKHLLKIRGPKERCVDRDHILQ